MNRSVLGVILGVCLCGSPFLRGAEHAARLYHDGAYAQAYSAYNALEPKSGDVWYNMGNCAYKNADIQNALLCWERALKTCSSTCQQDCYENIRFVTKKTGIAYQMNSAWVESVPLAVWQLIVLIVWYLFCWSAVAGKRRYTTVLFIVNITFGYCVVRAYTCNARTKARVITPTPIFVLPNDQAHIRAKLDSFAPLTLLGTKDSWYKVQQGNIRGWVAMENIAIV